MAGRRPEEEVFLKGIIKWCKHLRPDMTFDPGKWSVDMYIEGLELEKVREWQAEGIKNKVKKDNDGWFITLSRKCSFKSKGGKIVGLEPPFVFRLEGEQKVPIVTLVGNGSVGVAKCALWSFNPSPLISGKALRWEALRVDEFKEYTVKDDWNTEKDPDQRQIRGIDEQEPLF